MPLLKAASDGVSNSVASTDDATLAQIARLYAGDARLDATSQALLARENKDSWNGPRTLERFEGLIALDTVKNEYRLHSQIHRWFLQGGDTRNVETLNERVYAELFQTPSSDPWLGLASADTYTALANGGRR